jgi:hypothetical protein
MPTYQIVSSDTIKDDSGRFIPVDPLNSDYQDYLAWVAAGNTATNFTPPSNTDTIYIYGNSSVGNSEVFNGTSGRILYNNAGVLGEIVTGYSGQFLQTTGTTSQWATVRNFKNALINGDFAIDQRVRPGDSVAHVSTSAFPNNDDAYTLDRWYILSDGNDIVDVTQATDAPTNQLTSIGLDVETINKKFGIAQIIEQSNCVGLIGQNVSLSFKARVTSTTKLDNIKAAIVSWSGTADTVTSDIISAWGAEGTNPTLIANATYENSPANLSVTTSWTTYTIENVAIDTASAKNIIVLIWSDVTDTTLGDFIYLTDVQLEAGNVATPYDRLPIDTQLERCLRYTYGLWQTSANAPFGIGLCTATNKFDTIIPYPVPMRGTPSATYSAGTTFRIYTTASFAANSIATAAISRNSLHMQATRTAADLTTGTAGLFQDANSGTFAYVVVSAEL